MRFEKTTEMKITVLPEQEKMLSSKKEIRKACKRKDVISFDIFNENTLVGFVMLRKFAEHSFFLWDYAIDYKYQNCKYGTIALKELIEKLEVEYGAKTITTTYISGNIQAKRLYEKIGFTETDIVNADTQCEVNMILNL